MDKDRQPPMNRETDISPAEVSPTHNHVSARRRKLLAATAAIPAVMTLRNGAAQAVGSIYGCVAHDNEKAQVEIGTDDFVIVNGHDHWIRVMGKRLVQNLPGGASLNLYCVETAPDATIPADRWQCFREDTGEEFTGNVSGNIDNGEDVALLAFLYFNDNGNDIPEPGTEIRVQYYPRIQAVTEAPPGWSPLTGSCLSSVHPNLNLLG